MKSSEILLDESLQGFYGGILDESLEIGIRGEFRILKDTEETLEMFLEESLVIFVEKTWRYF